MADNDMANDAFGFLAARRAFGNDPEVLGARYFPECVPVVWYCPVNCRFDALTDSSKNSAICFK